MTRLPKVTGTAKETHPTPVSSSISKDVDEGPG